jgi:hypothetical protein
MDRNELDHSNEDNAAVLPSAEDMTDEVLLRAAANEMGYRLIPHLCLAGSASRC